MGDHTKAGTGKLAPAVLDFLRAHKGLTRIVATLAVGVAVSYVPSFPGAEVLAGLSVLLGI